MMRTWGTTDLNSLPEPDVVREARERREQTGQRLPSPPTHTAWDDIDWDSLPASTASGIIHMLGDIMDGNVVEAEDDE